VLYKRNYLCYKCKPYKNQIRLTNFYQFQLNFDNFTWLLGYLVTITRVPLENRPGLGGLEAIIFIFTQGKRGAL
jgi:hypothetical protein